MGDTVWLLYHNQRVQDWTGAWSDAHDLLGVFSTDEAAIRWLRKSRICWNDREPLMPVRHPGGYSLAGGRYSLEQHDVDPKPITREDWAMRVGATAMAGDGV